MGADDVIAVKARRLFAGPIYPVLIECAPEMTGLRYNGQRWVDETRPDNPMLVMVPHKQPGLDMFGGSGIRKPPRPKPQKPKSRRRGGF